MTSVRDDDRAEGPTPELAERQARALGHPTRFALFRWLVHAGEAADVPTLAALVDVHPNAVRRHLRALVDAGLAVETVATTGGRGRPRHRFAVAPDHADPAVARQRYAELARLLAEAVRTGASAREVGHRAGARSAVADGLGAGAAGSAGLASELDALVDQLADWGFAPAAPAPPASTDGATCIVLRACPFAEAAEEEPAAICELHQGLVEGFASQSEHLEVRSLRPRPPTEAACELSVGERARTDAAQPPAPEPTG
jgi:predicted ArsR family transcriptional regulator